MAKDAKVAVQGRSPTSGRMTHVSICVSRRDEAAISRGIRETAREIVRALPSKEKKPVTR